MKGLSIFPILFLISLFVVLPVVHAQSDIPYHNPPTPSGCNNFYTSVNKSTNANFSAVDAVVGVKDSDFTGKRLLSIGFYLCSQPTNNAGSSIACPTSDSNPVTLGVFNSVTGALVKSFGSVALSSLPCGQVPPSVEFTFSGSYVMTSGDMIGVTFSNNMVDEAVVECAKTCTGTVLSNGGVVDCPNSGGCAISNGFALGGDIVFNTQTLCNQGNSGAIVGAEAIVIIFAIMMAQAIGQAFGGNFSNRLMKYYLQIIIAVALAIFISALILGQLPAGIGQGC